MVTADRCFLLQNCGNPYYLHGNSQERAVVDKVLMYICGKTFEGVLFECGIRIGEKGALLDVPEEE